jgi:hypothetical protein
MNNEFDLERAINGDPIETVSGIQMEFVTYRPTASVGKQVIVRDGTTLWMYRTNGKYYDTDTNFYLDLRMKTPLKQINWAKLPIDTVITLNLCTGEANRYFNSFTDGLVRYYRGGMTSKTIMYKSDILYIHLKNMKISPDQPWTVWQGGACPIPEGLEYEVITRGGAAPLTNRGGYHLTLWPHTQNGSHSMSEIIAYRLTGKVLDGWTL